MIQDGNGETRDNRISGGQVGIGVVADAVDTVGVLRGDSITGTTVAPVREIELLRIHRDRDHQVTAMGTYLIVRRSGWRTGDELQEAARRTSAEVERMPEDVRWIRSYVIAETDGSLGTACIYQASSPEAIRRHAYAATLPVDEIVAVAETLVVRPDPHPIAI